MYRNRKVKHVVDLDKRLLALSCPGTCFTRRYARIVYGLLTVR